MKEALKEIMDNRSGLVFKSPITGEELSTPKRQLKKIKDAANIPELTMHFFRHIAVSAFGEMGLSNTILSAALGHTNLQTVNDYYLSANHTKSSEKLNTAINQLLLENKEE
jgi:integrase